MKGIIDRFEGDLAVILVEEDSQEFTENRNQLPKGSKENTILKLKKVQNTYQIIEIDEEATNKAQQKTTNLMQQLQAKKKKSKFKRE